MKMSKTLYVSTGAAWRAWLARNHESETEIWLIHYKKHTGRPSLPYEEAVNEALCFGWIDSLVQRIDSEKYARKFTPRKAQSRWSELNKRRVKALIGAGRMTSVGSAKIPDEVPHGRVVPETQRQTRTSAIPHSIKQVLIANSQAWKNFKGLAPSYQRLYVKWITAAQKEETRARRTREAIALLSKGRKLGLK
ncbi:MAG: YdeI/OmpD-associated family protein [Acidobacteriia bacterium]|nr:YdeI/OmpD-associated family protein [Terriglobia bacterium]